MQMYKYNGVDTGADALTAFAKEGYKGTAALDVPKEVSVMDLTLQKLRGNASMVSQPRLAHHEMTSLSSDCPQKMNLTFIPV